MSSLKTKCLRLLFAASLVTVANAGVHSAAIASTSTGNSQQADKVTDCHGTEPFWGLTIDRNKLRFEFLDDLNIEVAHHGANGAAGTMKSFVAFYQGWSRGADGKATKLEAIIQEQECSDFMSDELFPYAVYLIHGNTLYRGCCSAPK